MVCLTFAQIGDNTKNINSQSRQQKLNNLYVKNPTLITSIMDGGAQDSGLRAGTENVASIVAMAAALKEATDNMESTNKKLKNMEEEFLGRLKSADIDFIRNGAKDHVFGNINISIKNEEGEALLPP